MSGYIKIYRQFQEHELWKERRVLSKAEAWLDILLQVQGKPEPDKHLIGMKVLITQRGQSIKSVKTWASRWRWTHSKVRRFLKLLENLDMIDTENCTVTTRLTVCNYDRYNPLRSGSDTEVKGKRSASDEHSATDNKGNKEKKDKKKDVPETFQCPESLNSPEFRQAWLDWVQHRKEIKKPLKPTMVAQQIKKLEEWGRVRAIAAIRHTIFRGWTGLREPSEQFGANSNNKPTGPKGVG